MATLQDEQAALRLAFQEAAYETLAALGLVGLAERRGWTLRPWLVQARGRSLLKRPR